MYLSYIAGALVAASTCVAQSSSSSNAEPCLQVANYWKQGLSDGIPARIARRCALSAPLVDEDALNMIDGFSATLELQSTLDWLKTPPSGYPFPAVDLKDELSKLRGQITSGAITSEILFEGNLSAIIARAHDGHLSYKIDGLSVFTYGNAFGMIDIVSMDGQEVPKIYLHNEMYSYALGTGRAPSAITQINGVDAAEWLTQQSQNGRFAGYQDPDALMNDFTYSPIGGEGGSLSLGQFALRSEYFGDSMTLKFENGTSRTLDNYASTPFSFNNVFDGPSFSRVFCNATNKALALGGSSVVRSSKKTPTKRQQSPRVTRLAEYPEPLVISSDGSFSGYFLITPGFEDVAIIAITEFPSTTAVSFQSTMSDFLDLCRSQNKKHLIIDVTGNGGGLITSMYDTFKQLFPTLEPYNAGNFRATQSLNLIGGVVTENARKELEANPNNWTAYAAAGGFSDWDARAFLNASGSRFSTWSDLYGPVKAHGGNYTNLIRWDIGNVEYVKYQSDLLISGYSGKSIGSQPFESQNIVILGDGRCSSSCTTLSHMLKWQGKVKSVAVGGRPQSGPMQQQGGVKGSQVDYLGTVAKNLGDFATPDQLSSLTTSELGPLYSSAETMVLRTSSAGADVREIGYNAKNNIAEGDTTYTPLQFVYEAADCKMYNRPIWISDVSWKWVHVAQNAFGLNGTTAWSSCAKDSTNHPSSLSGNATLFNGGKINNVTDFIKQGTDESGGNENAGGKLASPLAFVFGLAAAVTFML